MNSAECVVVPPCTSRSGATALIWPELLSSASSPKVRCVALAASTHPQLSGKVPYSLCNLPCAPQLRALCADPGRATGRSAAPLVTAFAVLSHYDHACACTDTIRVTRTVSTWAYVYYRISGLRSTYKRLGVSPECNYAGFRATLKADVAAAWRRSAEPARRPTLWRNHRGVARL